MSTLHQVTPAVGPTTTAGTVPITTETPLESTLGSHHEPVTSTTTTTEPIITSTEHAVEPTSHLNTSTPLESSGEPAVINTEEGAVVVPNAGAAHPEPIREGLIGIKTSFLPIYYKKLYFFLQDEPLAPESLVEYLRKEKNTQNAHPNYAHANHTGKGLLFFCKTHEDKAKPTGMFNLAGAKISTSGHDKFSLKSANGNHELNLESSESFRDSWVYTLKNEIELATAAHPTVTSSNEYTNIMNNFTHKPSLRPTEAIAGTAGAAAVVDAMETKKEDKELKKEHKKEKKIKKDNSSDSSDSDVPAITTSAATGAAVAAEEHKISKEEKKRSASKTRQRFSFFGGKKEEKEVKELRREEDTNVIGTEPVRTEHIPEVPVIAATAAAPVVAAETAHHHSTNTVEPTMTTGTEHVAPVAASAPINDETTTSTSAPLASESAIAPTEHIASPVVGHETAVEDPVVGGSPALAAVSPSEPMASPRSNRKSFLGGFGFGKKKEEKKEEMKASEASREVAAGEPVTSSATTAPITTEIPFTEGSTTAPLSSTVEPTTTTTATEHGVDSITPVPVAAPISKNAAVEEEVVPATDSTTTGVASATPTIAKASLFDNIIDKLKAKPASHAVVTTENRDHVPLTEAIAAEVKELTHHTNSNTATTEGQTETLKPVDVVTPLASPSQERKGSNFFGFGKKEPKSDTESEPKPKRSFSIFKGSKKNNPLAKDETVATTGETELPSTTTQPIEDLSTTGAGVTTAPESTTLATHEPTTIGSTAPEASTTVGHSTETPAHVTSTHTAV